MPIFWCMRQDLPLISERMKLLEKLPSTFRRDMKKAEAESERSKRAMLISIVGQMQDLISRGYTDEEKNDLRKVANKILTDLKKQFNLEDMTNMFFDSKSVTDAAKVISNYTSTKGGFKQAKIIETPRGYTVITTDPKLDKDFQTQAQSEKYLESKGFKIADKSFKVKYRDRTFIVKAKDHKSAANKIAKKLKENNK